jgi:peptidylprolyl isomerase
MHVGADLIYGIQDVQAGDGSSVFLAMTVTSGTEVLERAEGTEVAPVEGLPVVTLDDTGKPSISFEGAVKPSALVAQPLIEGEGDVVEVGDSITIHYTGWLWDGEQFDSSWDAGSPATFTLAEGSLISGWVQGLAGQTVGSQVLLVIPPELGYGEAGSGTIPGGSTLVFVVDILATS